MADPTDTDLAAATPERSPDTTEAWPEAPGPLARPKPPSVQPPPGACDAHIQMPGGPADLPAAPGAGPDGAPRGTGFDDWLDVLRDHMETLGLSRGVIVQSVLFGADNAPTAEAVRRLGHGFRGVGLVPEGAGADALDRLKRGGMCGVRLDLIREGAAAWEALDRLAPLLAERDMHAELLLRAEDHLPALAERIASLPVPVVIDHMGLPDTARGPGAPGFSKLPALLAEGRAWVKLSGAYRVSDAPYGDTRALLRALVEANPERCLWGSDWPHLDTPAARMPDAGQLLDAFHEAVPEPEHRQRILVDNPATLYGF